MKDTEVEKKIEDELQVIKISSQIGIGLDEAISKSLKEIYQLGQQHMKQRVKENLPKIEDSGDLDNYAWEMGNIHYQEQVLKVIKEL